MLDDDLKSRLLRLGLRGVREVRTHHNRVVMLSLRRGVLRVHAGYAAAPDDVLQAIVRYLKPWSRRAARREAERDFLAFPAHEHAPSRPRRPRRRSIAPGDLSIIARLREAHARLNQAHFAGALRAAPFRISGRMRRRLGDVTLDTVTGEAEIGMNRRHARHDPWPEVEQTLLHEMVHQWQVESGLPLDHGAAFRRKAKEVGVLPRAKRPYPAR